MNIVLVGTSHKCCPVEVRDRLFFTKNVVSYALKAFRVLGGIKGAVILSTCNRVELYADTDDADGAIIELKEFLARYHGEEQFRLEPYLYSAAGKGAVLHLFSVAAGVESQIVGESEILQQIRLAHGEAKRAGATSDILDVVFGDAIDAGIKARNSTGISEGNVSIATVAASLVKERLGSLEGKKILVIGAGQISESVVRELAKESLKIAFVANRTYEKALRLAGHAGAEVMDFDCLRHKLSEVDVVISAISSPKLILRKEDFQGAGKRPGLIIDLSMPRNVEPAIKGLGVSLYCLDDLDFAVQKNIGRRELEIPSVLAILSGEVEKTWENLLAAGLLTQESVPVP